MSFIIGLILDPDKGTIEKFLPNILRKIHQALEKNQLSTTFDFVDEKLVVELPTQDETFTREIRINKKQGTEITREIQWIYLPYDMISIEVKIISRNKPKKYYFYKDNQASRLSYDKVWVDFPTEYVTEIQKIDNILNVDMIEVWQWSRSNYCHNKQHPEKTHVIEEDDWYYYDPSLNEKISQARQESLEDFCFDLDGNRYKIEIPLEPDVYGRQKKTNADGERLVRCLQMDHRQYTLQWLRQTKHRRDSQNFFFES